MELRPAVDARSPIEPRTSADTRPTRSTVTTWSSSTPPKRKTTLNSGTDTTSRRMTNISEESSFPVTIPNGRTRVQRRRSRVWRSRSPLIAPAVSAGTMKIIRTSAVNASEPKTARPTIGPEGPENDCDAVAASSARKPMSPCRARKMVITNGARQERIRDRTSFSTMGFQSRRRAAIMWGPRWW